MLVFLPAAVSAAAPGVWDVAGTYDDASVSITVTSNVTHFTPLCGDDTASSRAWSTVLVSVFTNCCLSAVTTGVSQADCLWAATPSGHGQV